MKRDKKIDAYIKKSPDFAQPILVHLRDLVHKACPQVEEKTKWGMPFFDYKNQPMCSMAAFKQHAVFGFWKAQLLKDTKNILGQNKAAGGEAMGNFGRLTSLKDLPADKYLVDFINQAMHLNDQGIKQSPLKKGAVQEVVVPDFIQKALSKNKKAKTVFEKFSNSHRREYVDWINEAKTEVTRNKRITTMMEWLEDGKDRNWKYRK